MADNNKPTENKREDDVTNCPLKKETFENYYKQTINLPFMTIKDIDNLFFKLKQLHDSDIILVFQDIFRNIEHISCGKDRIHMSKQYYFKLKNKWIGLTPEEEKEYDEWKNKKSHY